MTVQLRGILPPFGFEISKVLFSLDVIGGLINSLKIFGDILTVLPPAEVQRMAHQMHDAGLDGGIQERGIDGVWEAFEAVYNGDQDIFYAPIAQIVHYREPELGPFIVGDPQPQNLAFAFTVDAQSHINGLVLDLTAFRVADFDA